MNNDIIIRNIEPQEITIEGATTVAGITNVYVNGVDVTVGTKAYVIVPTKTSDLVNDSGFITSYTETDPTVPAYVKAISVADINAWNNKQDELVSGTNIKTINNTSLLGSGDIQITATEYQAGTGIDITGDTISNTITSYQDLTDLPTIPNKTSDLINDSGFITNTVNDLTNYLTTNVLETILPQTSGTGTEIYLQDTAPYKLHLKLDPSEIGQFTTTGKNLITNNLTNTTTEISDVTFVGTENGTILTSGTASAGISLYLLDDWITLPAGTYTLSDSIISGESNTTYFLYGDVRHTDNSAWDEKAFSTYYLNTRTIEESFKFKPRIVIRSGINVNDLEFKPMLESGNTATSYEPYTGGIPAPNPLYPQDIHTITDENSITIGNKNLCNGTSLNVWLNTAVTICGMTTGDSGLYIPVSGGNYTISSNITQTRYRVACTLNEPSLSSQAAYNGTYNDGTKNTITIDTTGYNYLVVNATDLTEIQIERGSTATSYVPHEETVYEVDIPYGMIYGKLGDYSDRVYCNIPSDPDYSSSYQLNHWYLKTNIRKIYLNNISNWTYDGLDGDGNYQFTGTNNIIIENPVVPNILICNYFGTTGNNKISITSNREIKVTFDPNVGITNLDDFESFINNNTVILYYVKNYSSRMDLNQLEEIMNQWVNILNNSTAYNGGTVITQENYDLPYIITASTFKKVSN